MLDPLPLSPLLGEEPKKPAALDVEERLSRYIYLERWLLVLLFWKRCGPRAGWLGQILGLVGL